MSCIDYRYSLSLQLYHRIARTFIFFYIFFEVRGVGIKVKTTLRIGICSWNRDREQLSGDMFNHSYEGPRRHLVILKYQRATTSDTFINGTTLFTTTLMWQQQKTIKNNILGVYLLLISSFQSPPWKYALLYLYREHTALSHHDNLTTHWLVRNAYTDRPMMCKKNIQ